MVRKYKRKREVWPSCTKEALDEAVQAVKSKQGTLYKMFTLALIADLKGFM